MKGTTFFQQVKITFIYCFPGILAWAFMMYPYHSRIENVGQDINVICSGQTKECVAQQVYECTGTETKENDSSTIADKTAASEHFSAENIEEQICNYRKDFRNNLKPDCRVNEDSEDCLIRNMTDNTDSILFSIFVYNSVAVFIMVMLPYLLMGNLLARSNRINLDYRQRSERSNDNWWLKFLVALIMSIGLIYIINPLGRGASTYYQFFIAVGLVGEQTLPIYIKTEDALTPVLAGFFGWYLHLIGYIFTKLIHHDVISARVYSLLFKKFIVTYGIALVVPGSGLLEDPETAAFFMFLVGLFPLFAMSVLIEAVSKFGSGTEKASASLSQLPGISRWQILRLEEEGVDSMASLANIQPKTVSENLQVIEKLTFFWVDIAQLFTIVGFDGYSKIKGHCLTASEFVHKSKQSDFIETIHGLEGVSEADEIARLLQKTFGEGMVSQDNPKSFSK